MSIRRPHAHLALPLALALFAGAAVPAAAQVRWRATGAPDLTPARDVGRALPAMVSAAPSRHVVVQLSAPPTEATRRVLADAGVRIGAPLGDGAFFATVDRARLDAAAVAATGAIAGVQAIDPAWKVHPLLTGGEWLPEVGQTVDTKGRAEPVVAVYVLMHEDVPNDARAAGLVERYGGQVRDALVSVNALVVEMPLSGALALAAEDGVQWIEPALPALGPNNAQNRALTHVDVVQSAPYNLTGAGVTVLVFDGGTALASHQDLAGRVTVMDSSGTGGHPTHVAGTIGGTGAASGGANRGMAPGVSLLSAGLQWSGSGFLYTNPGDIEQDYANALGLGADVANNSIGTNTETNGFPCSWQGDYGVTDAVIDAIVRGSLGGGQPFRVVWAAGNERQGSRCDVEGHGDYYSNAPPAGAKNHLCIGAVNANDDSMTSFSSWGPTDDGRLKPDFSAPGCQVGGDGGVTSTYSSHNASYATLCGTSMACPTVTGIVALMLEDWAVQFPSAPLPRNSTLKVLLAQSAVDRGNVGPDYQFGYGSVRADAAIDLMRTGAFYERSLGQGFVDRYTVQVAPGSGPLVVTAAWDDAPGTPNVIPSLVNDLDVRVYEPGGARHFPWTLNPNAPSAPATRTQEDHRNNIEQVRVDDPIPGEWVVEVHGTSVPVGPQPYSIVSSHPAFDYTGSVSLTIDPVALAPDYLAPGVPVTLQVDVDIQGDTLVPGSVRLHHRPGPGTSFVDVPMTDSGGGLFQATLPGASCSDVPEYYFSAEGELLGVLTLPAGGAAAPYRSFVGDPDLPITLAEDAMEIDSGWTVGAPGDAATTGIWNRMDPQPTDAQPGDDHTPAPGVMCWVTDGNAGSGVGAFDIDGGATTLISPVYNLAGQPAASISYWRWYSNDAGASPNADVFVVDISNDGGATWTNVETVGPSGPGTSGGWIQHSFRVGDVITPSDSIRLRFIASDLGAGSIVEAAIDDLRVETITCEDGCPADFDGDGNLTAADFSAFRAAFLAGDPSADFDGDTNLTPADFSAFRAAFLAGCP